MQPHKDEIDNEWYCKLLRLALQAPNAGLVILSNHRYLQKNDNNSNFPAFGQIRVPFDEIVQLFHETIIELGQGQDIPGMGLIAIKYLAFQCLYLNTNFINLILSYFTQISTDYVNVRGISHLHSSLKLAHSLDEFVHFKIKDEIYAAKEFEFRIYNGYSTDLVIFRLLFVNSEPYNTSADDPLHLNCRAFTACDSDNLGWIE